MGQKTSSKELSEMKKKTKFRKTFQIIGFIIKTFQLMKYKILFILLILWKFLLDRSSAKKWKFWRKKKRLKKFTSEERKELISKKLKMHGLNEGSGVKEKDQTYNEKKKKRFNYFN